MNREHDEQKGGPKKDQQGRRGNPNDQRDRQGTEGEPADRREDRARENKEEAGGPNRSQPRR